MPASWIFALIFYGIAVLAVLWALSAFFIAKNTDAGISGVAVVLITGIIGGLFNTYAAYDKVDTRNVGIVTEFGKPVGVRGAGVAWHAPWQQIHELSEAIQLQAFESNSYDDAAKGQGANNNPAAIGVRLANNSMAYVNENLNWRLKEGAAPKLFQDYGGANVFDTIKQQLVDRQAQVALAKAFAAFNPQTLLAAAAAAPGAQQAPAPAQGVDVIEMAKTVKQELQVAVGQEVEILDVRIQGIFYDPATQSRIDAYNQKVQETINAQQDVKTAEQQRDAAAQRAMQPIPDLRIAQFNCVNQAAADHRDAAGCFGQIGGTPLIQIPPTK